MVAKITETKQVANVTSKPTAGTFAEPSVRNVHGAKMKHHHAILFVSLSALACTGEDNAVGPNETEFAVDSVTISPSDTTLIVGETQRFTTVVHGTGNFDSSVAWAASAGAIDLTGFYAAPDTSVVDTVRAVSITDSAKSANTLVTVIAVVDSIIIWPDTATVVVGDTLQFRVEVQGRGDFNRAFTLSATAGTVVATSDSTGRFIAPHTVSLPPTQVVTIRATSSEDSTKTGEAQIIVTVVVDSIDISPDSVTLEIGDTQQFTATVFCRGNCYPTVEWTATTGTIDSTGLYTAPNVATDGTITAISVADSTQVDTATVTVEEALGIVQPGDLFGFVGESPVVFVSINTTTGEMQELSTTPFVSVTNFAAAFDPDNKKYFVSAWDGTASRLAQIDLVTGDLWVAPTPWSMGSPWTLEYNAATGRLFGTVKTGGELVVVDVDPSTGEMQQLFAATFVSVTNYADAFDPDNQKYFVSAWDGAASRLGRIDPVGGDIWVASEPWSIGPPWTLEFNPVTGRLVGTVKAGGELVVVDIDPATGEMQQSFATTFTSVTNYADAFDPETQKYFVSAWDGTESRFARIDLATGDIWVTSEPWSVGPPRTLEFHR